MMKNVAETDTQTDTQAAPRKLMIDIWSDVMCPWCLIGWGNLQQGLALVAGEITADIRWHAFELNPDMPPEGEERTAHIARKYGRTLDQSREVQGQMRIASGSAGVSLEYEGEEPAPPAMMWNTLLAHKLLAWALAEYGAVHQTRLKMALFTAHFNHRRKIGERDVLIAIAEQSGLSRDGAAAAIGGDDFTGAVRADERAAYDMNISGVPAMIVEEKFMIPGAQPPETYANILRRIAAKSAA